ncbi:IQ domain-containing protein F2 [Symphalangus syndactylus]|uniref:IQ domain-containing protein F2 n=1 Tax=Symphalangus syndactylus TaxID=9590 RepID=UPI0024424B6D|nr:IQ domain-containing protein F2 [Symphalangus syndactylus]
MRVRFCTKGNLILVIIEDVEESIEWEILQKKKQQKIKEKLRIRTKATVKIQAWWRGTLVRRTLLHAALRAWIIQRWWRMTLLRVLEKKRQAALIAYATRERAVIKLQSLVRMWRVRWRYCQVLNAIYVIQDHWQCHDCQTCALLRGHCVVTATHLQFHIEIINS